MRSEHQLDTYAISDELKVGIHNDLMFLAALKNIGKEYEEVEGYINRLSEKLNGAFTDWLKVTCPEHAGIFGEFIPSGLLRFLYLQPTRRFHSPLSCGAKLQDRFCRVAARELKMPAGGDRFFAIGVDLFNQFRQMLKLVVN